MRAQTQCEDSPLVMTAHRRTVGTGQLQQTRTAVSHSCGPQHPQQWIMTSTAVDYSGTQHRTKTFTAQCPQQWATTSTAVDQNIHNTIFTAVGHNIQNIGPKHPQHNYVHSIQRWTTTPIPVDPNDHSNGPQYLLTCHTVQMLIYLRCFHDDNATLGKQGCIHSKYT